MVEVVHLKTDSYDTLIDRTTMWGNPFRIGKDGNRSEVIEKFRRWLKGESHTEFKQKERQKIICNIDSLDGKTIGCWCKPKSCHGDTYADIVEERKSGVLKL